MGNDENDDMGLDVVEQFDTYEDYLDSQLNPTDLYYLEDEDVGRQLVEWIDWRRSIDLGNGERRWNSTALSYPPPHKYKYHTHAIGSPLIKSC